MKHRRAHEVVLGGTPYYFMMSKVEAIEYQLHDKIEVLIDNFSDENVLDFFRDFIRSSYRRKTAKGYLTDDESAVNFLNSADYDELIRIIFVDNAFPEETLADFIASTAWNLHDLNHQDDSSYNIFNEESAE